ncbi:MAG: BLUF domain-containing protein [Pseudomonadota bacterium]
MSPSSNNSASNSSAFNSGSGASPAPLAALIYKSRSTRQFDPETLGDLVSRAQARNAAEGLTGAVFYGDGQFLQWLEGPVDRLDDVAASISRDERHTDIALLSYGLVRTRMFSDWSMRLLAREPSRRVAQAPNRFDGDMRPTIAARELIGGDERAASAFLELAPATAAGAAAQCEKIAAAYLPLWQAELCDDADMTIGLSHLLRVFRRRTTSFAPAYRSLASRFLVAPAPGEPHFFGAAFVAEFLRDKGYGVDYFLPMAEEDLVERVTTAPFEAVVIATSPVFSRTERAGDLMRLVDVMRNASADNKLNFTIYGQAPATPFPKGVGRVISRVSEIDPDPSRPVTAGPLSKTGARRLH